MKKYIIIIFAFVTLWLLGFITFHYVINHYPIPENIKTDAIVVLTGGKNRINVAVSLLREKKAEKLFISGVNADVSIKELEKRKDLDLKELENIYLGKKAYNTAENALESMEWIKNNNIKTIRLVTSNYHVPRSLQEFYGQDEDIKIIMHPVYSNTVNKKWWKKWKSFCLVASEYNKFMYVYLTIKVKNVINKIFDI